MGTRDRLQSASTPAGSLRRQPRGVREGGQFAHSPNSESSVSLVNHDELEETQRHARQFIRRYGLTGNTVSGYMDADDLTQDAIVAYLVATKTDRPVDVKLPVATIAKRSIIRALEGTDHKRFSALRLYEAHLATREDALERPLSPLERDMLADEVRTSLPINNRPSVGFHLPTVNVKSLDGLQASDRFRQDDVRTDQYDRVLRDADERRGEANLNDFAEGSSGDRAAQFKADGKQVAARALAWNAIAEHAGAPLCVTESIGKRAAIRARANVNESGGPLECARAYLDDGTTTDDLFAPFGSITDAERRVVCETLVRHELYAEDLWRVAISQAEGRTV